MKLLRSWLCMPSTLHGHSLTGQTGAAASRFGVWLMNLNTSLTHSRTAQGVSQALTCRMAGLHAPQTQLGDQCQVQYNTPVQDM